MAKRKSDEEPNVGLVTPDAAPAPASEGPKDYRRAVNLTNRPINGVPLADGTSISMGPGPFSADGSHISRAFLNKFNTPFIRRLERDGKIRLEASGGA